MRDFGLSWIEGGESKLQDLIMGCLICGHDRKGFYDFLERRDLKKELKRLGKGLDVKNLEETFALFKKYLADGIASPEIEVPDREPGMMPGAPWLQQLRVVLMSKLGISFDDAWDYPYSLAVWDYYTFLEVEGKIRIIGEFTGADADEIVDELVKRNLELQKQFEKGEL